MSSEVPRNVQSAAMFGPSRAVYAWLDEAGGNIDATFDVDESLCGGGRHSLDGGLGRARPKRCTLLARSLQGYQEYGEPEQLSLAKELLARGADPNQGDVDTLLWALLISSGPESDVLALVTSLLEHGAFTDFGKAAKMAEDSARYKVLKVLRESRGAIEQAHRQAQSAAAQIEAQKAMEEKIEKAAKAKEASDKAAHQRLTAEVVKLRATNAEQSQRLATKEAEVEQLQGDSARLKQKLGASENMRTQLQKEEGKLQKETAQLQREKEELMIANSRQLQDFTAMQGEVEQTSKDSIRVHASRSRLRGLVVLLVAVLTGLLCSIPAGGPRDLLAFVCNLRACMHETAG